MKAVFCFIDDAGFELTNFRDHAAPAFERAEFVYARSFAEAAQALEGRQPLCFLLDIYGSRPEGQAAAGLPRPEELELPEPLDRGGLWQGLDEAEPSGEEANRFLRRLHARVEAWQGVFRAAAAALNQGNAFGLANLAQVRERHQWAAALGYSRKALYADAAEMTRAGADGVLQKPQGADQEAIARATREAAPELARACYRAVDLRLGRLAGQLAAELCLGGQSLGLAEALAEAARHLGAPLAGEPRGGRPAAAEALGAQRLEGVELNEEQLGGVLAIRRWLAAAQS
jgi:DNA-binding NarL/FixJ family response regulator